MLIIVVVLGELMMGHKIVLGVQRSHHIQVILVMGVLFILLASVLAENQDYYSLLGVGREATTREIRQAFKKLALTMHPDKNPVSYFEKPQTINFETTLDIITNACL